jgi:hypothetical protein
VFQVNDAYRSEGGGRRGRGGSTGSTPPNMGENPPAGVVFNYFLQEGMDTTAIRITIFDKKNKPIKTFSRNAKEAADQLDYNSGMNKFIWDMNYPPGERSEGMILWNGGIGSVKAAPGKYRARFVSGKDTIRLNSSYKFAINSTRCRHPSVISEACDLRSMTLLPAWIPAVPVTLKKWQIAFNNN